MFQVEAKISSIEKTILSKINELNDLGVAAIFSVTGGNGTGKTHMAKYMLTYLLFHQSFNLGLVTKTIRCLTDAGDVTVLENFRNESIDKIFTHIIQYSCSEYQNNGVNVLIDGVQIDTVALREDSSILGGVILDVSVPKRIHRNNKPSTHFKRKLAIHSTTDVRRYFDNDKFKTINNDGDFLETYQAVLEQLDYLLDKKLNEIRNN